MNQVITIERTGDDFALATTGGDARQEFGRQLMRAAVGAEQQRRRQWETLEDEWLELKRSKSESRHTVRNYQAALARFKEFLVGQFVEGDEIRSVELWDVDQTHVRGWQAAMRSNELGESTINHQLSCVSSFYSFVLNEKRMVNGVEIDLLVDRLGRKRDNPFKVGNLRRGRVEQYERARPLTIAEYAQLLNYLESQSHTLAGARNYALILTYLHTGWRSAELLRMQWRDIRPSRSQPGTFVFAWEGKGAKKNDDVLPADCWHAIVAYLKKAGRFTPGAPGREEGLALDEFVWLPVTEPNMSGLRNQGEAITPGQPISEKSALRVLRTALKLAGVPDAGEFRIHDLRHTHAHLLLESGESMPVIQARLHHSSLATTGLYLKAVRRNDPVDTYTAKFAQLRMAV